MITHPESLHVAAGSYFFAPTLTDLGGALQGSLGLAASANLNPGERRGPALFQPVHGSAPDIAGRGIANPTAADPGVSVNAGTPGRRRNAADRVMNARKAAMGQGRVRTPDLGGRNSTEEFAAAVAGRLKA